MYDYYIKIKEGFEYCKKNLEGDLSPQMFQSTTVLCKNYVNLCNHYKSIIKKECSKGDYKYISGVIENNTNVLAGMISTWVDQYNDSMDEDEREEQKTKDAYNALVVQDGYQRQMIENRVKVKGFMNYLPKKRGRKKGSK
jgi:hypothetical protein